MTTTFANHCSPGAAMLDAATTGHAAENDWQRYLVDQARNWIDGWAKDPLNKLEDVCDMVAKIAGGDSSFCRRRIAGQKYLERLLCLVWLGPEEREAVVPALATFQAWRD